MKPVIAAVGLAMAVFGQEQRILSPHEVLESTLAEFGNLREERTLTWGTVPRDPWSPFALSVTTSLRGPRPPVEAVSVESGLNPRIETIAFGTLCRERNCE